MKNNIINLITEPIGETVDFSNALEQMLWIYVEADEYSEWVKHWDQLFSLKGIEVPSRGDKEKHEFSNWIGETMIMFSNELKLMTEFINSNQGD